MLCLVSVLFTSCGDDTSVDDWLGTYTGDEVFTLTDLSDDSTTTNSEARTVVVVAGATDNTIIVTVNSNDPDTHTIDGDKANFDPIEARIESFGWEPTSGDITLDGDKVIVDYSYNILDVDGNPTTKVDVIGEYTRQ